MNLNVNQLLQQLEPAIRPASAPAPSRSPRAPLEQSSFDDLLTLVATGAMHSGRHVTVGPQAVIEPELREEQLGRIAAAADQAEAAGASRSLVLIDGRSLVVDVPARELAGELGRPGFDQVVRLDSAVFVAGDDDETAPVSSISSPGLGQHFGGAGLTPGIAPPLLSTPASPASSPEAPHGHAAR